MIDDKLRILDAIKHAWGDRVTTVFPRQGHYARDPILLAEFPLADIAVEHIGDLWSTTWPPHRRSRNRTVCSSRHGCNPMG